MFMDEEDLLNCEWCGGEYAEDESDAINTEIFCSVDCEEECLASENEEEDDGEETL